MDQSASLSMCDSAIDWAASEMFVGLGAARATHRDRDDGATP